MSGKWKVYKRNCDLWLGYQRDGQIRGLVRIYEDHLTDELIPPRPWRLSQAIASAGGWKLRNVQAIVDKLDLPTPHKRRAQPPFTTATEYDLLDYLGEHAMGSEAQARLVLGALAAKLDALGCRLYM